LILVLFNGQMKYYHTLIGYGTCYVLFISALWFIIIFVYYIWQFKSLITVLDCVVHTNAYVNKNVW